MDRLTSQRFRRMLQAHRNQTLEFLSQLEEEICRSDCDTWDDTVAFSNTSVSEQFLFEQSSQKMTLLRMIDAALQRIRDGKFGMCLQCGTDIQTQRLELVPWTEYCLHCKETLEATGAEFESKSNTRPYMKWKQAG